MPERICSVDGCDKPRDGRRLCSAHYHRLVRYGDPLGQPIPRVFGICVIEGCGQRIKARGLCGKHNYRLKVHGDPLVTERDYGAKRRMARGYVCIWAPDHPLARADGYVFEHRKVLHDAGISVPSDHHVHHRNEKKDDNRLENLEVLTPAEHKARHAEAGTLIRNQYGAFPVKERP